MGLCGLGATRICRTVWRPFVNGTRVAVESILHELCWKGDIGHVLATFPGLTSESVRACLGYAADVLDQDHARMKLKHRLAVTPERLDRLEARIAALEKRLVTT